MRAKDKRCLVTGAARGAELGDVLSRPIEIVSADHQNKPDLGSAIARERFDQRGVGAIADLTSSAVALAVQKLAADREGDVEHGSSDRSAHERRLLAYEVPVGA